jgi:serine/threonine-protein phosphatase 4 regulatory subunit 4
MLVVLNSLGRQIADFPGFLCEFIDGIFIHRDYWGCLLLFHCPRNGQDVQKMSVILGLSSLMAKNPMETQKKVLPKICELLSSSQVEFQVEAANAFSRLLDNKQLTTQAFNSILFHEVLNGVENKDTTISSAWLKTLLVAISYYSPEVIKREILPLALSKGQLSQSVSSRLASCEMLGVIATKFDGFRVRRELLSLVNSLCQDVDYEVRSCMCRQLEAITKQLGAELSGTLILPELVELAKDEECSVRISSLETLVSIIDQLDKDVKRSTIIPLLQQCFESALAVKDASLQAVSRLYGKFCHSLKGEMLNYVFFCVSVCLSICPVVCLSSCLFSWSALC